jgi:RNA polymerase sigma-70 factor (ECF subfamily)
MEAIERVVRTLPEHYQAVFILYYFQNLSLEEVATQLNRPAPTCKVYLHRARQMLYKRLKQSAAVTSAGSPVSNA